MSKTRYRFDFMQRRPVAVVLSAVLLVAAVAGIATRGLAFGIDFTGGTVIELGYEVEADLDAIRDTLGGGGFEDAVVQRFGSDSDVLIKVAPRPGTETADVSDEVVALLPGAELRRVEFVGPQVGDELAEDGGLAMVYALGAILVYIALRFKWKFAVGAIAALVHDVTVVVGFFALSGMEFDLPVLAAVLAVIGYSLNDTIVVFDRIRENFRKVRKGAPVEVINISLNQTFARTVITSMTTLFVLLALFLLGGELIHAFATALIVGVLVGTYSSIFVASPITLALDVTREDLMPVEKEGAEVDSRP